MGKGARFEGLTSGAFVAYHKEQQELPAELYRLSRRSGKDMSDLDDKVKEDVALRRKWTEQRGFGFELPSVVPNVPKCTENPEVAVAA